jgi:tetratricopeptide (TPR) repeat protein
VVLVLPAGAPPSTPAAALYWRGSEALAALEGDAPDTHALVTACAALPLAVHHAMALADRLGAAEVAALVAQGESMPGLWGARGDEPFQREVLLRWDALPAEGQSLLAWWLAARVDWTLEELQGWVLPALGTDLRALTALLDTGLAERIGTGDGPYRFTALPPVAHALRAADRLRDALHAGAVRWFGEGIERLHALEYGVQQAEHRPLARWLVDHRRALWDGIRQAPGALQDARGDGAATPRWLHALGWAASQSGDAQLLVDVGAALARALETRQRTAPPARWAQALCEQAMREEDAGRLSLGFSLLRLIEEHLPMDDPGVQAWVSFTRGTLRITSSDHIDEALEALRSAAALGEASGERLVAARALANEGSLHVWREAHHLAIPVYEHVAALACGAGWMRLEGIALTNLALCLSRVASESRDPGARDAGLQLGRSVELGLEAVARFATLGEPFSSGVARNNLGVAQCRALQIDDADASFRLALEELPGPGGSRHRIFARYNRVVLALCAGDPGRAQQRLVELEEEGTTAREDPMARHAVLLGPADVAWELGQWERAAHHTATTLAGLTATEVVPGRAARTAWQLRVLTRLAGLPVTGPDPGEETNALPETPLYAAWARALAGTEGALESLMTEAAAWMPALVRRVHTPPAVRAWMPQPVSIDVWWAIRRLMRWLPETRRRQLLEAREAGEPVQPILWVDMDGLSVRPGDAPWVSMVQRPKAFRLLAMVARGALDRDGEAGGVEAQALIDALWPGETLVRDSARGRLHSTVTQLRGFGLRDMVVRQGEHYRLAAGWTVRVWQDGRLMEHLSGTASLPR